MTLRSLMGIGDIKLRMCTAISMVRLGQHLEARDMVEVAADREVRNCFYDKLEILGNHDIFPEEYKTQEAFAESNMVNWLTYPTELGRVPDEIQLMNVFDTGGEEYYLFRFKCTSSEDWVEKGWMVGVSGPFDKRFKPTTTAEGHTFSHFGRWEDNTPEEHFDTIIGSIRRYWVRQP